MPLLFLVLRDGGRTLYFVWVSTGQCFVIFDKLIVLICGLFSTPCAKVEPPLL